MKAPYFFFLSAFPKSCLDLKRAAKYWFDEIERHQRGNKKLTRSENDLGGKIVTQIRIELWIPTKEMINYEGTRVDENGKD